MINNWFFLEPCFKWCLILHSLCWISIQNIGSSVNSFCPKFLRQSFSDHHTPSHFCNCSVLPLGYTILLRTPSNCELSLNSILFAVLHKRSINKFSSKISLKCLNFKALCFSTSALNLRNVEKASDFSLRKYTHIIIM